jgi:hypothetical protein
MRIAARLKRLEEPRGADSCGPNCPPLAVVVSYQDGYDGEASLGQGQRPPAPCPRCGRRARVEEIVVVFVPDFFHKPERLAMMKGCWRTSRDWLLRGPSARPAGAGRAKCR